MLTKCVIAKVEGVVTASEQPGEQQDQRLAAPRQELNVGQVGQHAHQERVVRPCPGSHVYQREIELQECFTERLLTARGSEELTAYASDKSHLDFDPLTAKIVL